MADKFWETIRKQLTELREAKGADDVVRILSHERNPYGSAERMGPDEGFFAGSGGSDTVMEALDDAGWTVAYAESGIHYVMQAPDGSRITYCEGDVALGDKIKR